MTNPESPPTESGLEAEENAQGPVSHSLLKKGGADDLLLMAYKKVEKKLEGALQVHLANVVDCDLKVEIADSKKMPFQDWISGQEGGSAYLEFQLGALENPILVRIARTFLSASVDCFFGGQFNGDTPSDGPLKKSEIAMIERLGAAIANGLANSWSTLFETTVRYSCCYYDKDDVELALEDPSIMVSATSIELSGHQIEAIEVIQTLDGLIAIEPQLNRPHLREQNEVDPVWKASLKDSVEQIYLPVRSVLARPTMLLSELSRLAVGDILPVAPTDNVPLIVGDRIFAHGSIGEQSGGVAFKIKNFL